MTQNYFTPRDRGHVEEINRALSQLEKDYQLDLSSEKEWLDGLNERFGKLPNKEEQVAMLRLEYEKGRADVLMEQENKQQPTIESIKAEVSRLGSAAYENYTRDNSDKEYWTYMTCKKISNFINSLTGETQMIREKVESVVKSVIKEMINKEK